MKRLCSILISVLFLNIAGGLVSCDVYRTQNTANTSNSKEKNSENDNNALIILESSDVKSIQESIRHVEGKGGRITHIYPPHILIGHIPEDIAKQLIREKGIVAIHYGLVDPSTVEKYGKTAVYAVEAWNNNFMGLATEKGLTHEPGTAEPPPIKGDALIPPRTGEPVKQNHD